MKTIKQLAAEFRQNAEDREKDMNACFEYKKRDMLSGVVMAWNAAAFELEQNIPVDKAE